MLTTDEHGPGKQWARDFTGQASEVMGATSRAKDFSRRFIILPSIILQGF